MDGWMDERMDGWGGWVGGWVEEKTIRTFGGAGDGVVVVLPPGRFRQRHENGLDATTRLEAKDRAVCFVMGREGGWVGGWVGWRKSWRFE